MQDCEEEALKKGPVPPSEKSECEVVEALYFVYFSHCIFAKNLFFSK